MDTFEMKLEHLLNECSMENDSNTPDFILARYLVRCLEAWNESVVAREQWYERPFNSGKVTTESHES